MHINKVGIGFNKSFKGYGYEKNNVGDTVYRFNYPYDHEKSTAYVEFFKVRENPSAYAGYDVIKEQPIKSIKLQKGGVPVSLKEDLGLNDGEAFAYRVMVDGKRVNETGINMDFGEYVLVTTHGTTPMVQGAAYLAFPDSQRPGAQYAGFDSDVTGTVVYNKELQKEAENTVRTFSNKFDGNLAGLEYDIPILAKNGYKVLFANPIAGGDNKSSHHYWNKNNFQISDDMGNIQNFGSFTRKLFQNGMKYVYDGTFTSEGLEGIHFQYALRWAEKNPQTYNWFKMSGIKNGPLSLGVVPKNKENLRHRVINAPVILNESGKVVENPNYDPRKETLFQIYDGSQVTEDQLNDLDKPIETYKNIKGGNFLKINTHNDTLINYVFEVTPKEYEKSLKNFAEFNKGAEAKVVANSPEGTIQIAQFTNFKLTKKTEGGFVAWDANTDMVKMNYAISNYDEKELQGISDVAERDYARKLRQIGAFEVQDMALQAGKYWTGKFKDIQSMYVAQVLKGAKTTEAMTALVEKGLLPKEAVLSQEQIGNVLNGWYNLEPKGVLAKDDVTIKAMMKMPLDAIEFAENTVGILSTSYFSNRATTDETVGMTRFELMKDNNPHLLPEYASTYLKVNDLYNNELKDFAHAVIAKMNEKSSEKLLTENGEYTEYGEYVMDLLGADIAKYALIKSLMGEKLQDKTNVKRLANGEITYDYPAIKAATTIKSLGIKAVNPKDEAEKLYKLISTGMAKVGESDVDYVAEALLKQIEGTNTNSFRLAEASVDKAALGLDWRLDAAKDVIDMDAVRTGDTHFDEAWEGVIGFWKKFVQIVKSENPYSYIVAEITDVDKLMKASIGDEHADVYANDIAVGKKFKNVDDAMMKLFNETGITSEAAYSYFFTDMIKVFGPEFENGTMTSTSNPAELERVAAERLKAMVNRLRVLTTTRSIDFIRNAFTFVGNHDKPRLLHGFALDMELFHADNEYDRQLRTSFENGVANFDIGRKYREQCMLALHGVSKLEELPLEVRLNMDNNEYFNTVSTRAAAMTTLLREAMNDSLKDVSADEMKFLRQALIDLTNGNYLESGENVQYQTVTIEALKNFENAIREMISTAEYQYGLNILGNKKEELIRQIVKNANNQDLVSRHLIHGDASWGGPNEDVGKANQEKTEKLLRGSSQNTDSGERDYCKFDSYVVALTSVLRDAIEADETISSDIKKSLYDAQRDFVKKYDAQRVKANRTELPIQESQQRAEMKNGYAARDIETAIKMLIVQAEYRARQAGKLGEKEVFADGDKILLNVFKAATEPAVKKCEMLYSALSILPGYNTLFGGDETAQSGYDSKSKNEYLPRNAVGWEALEEGPLKDYKREIYERINKAMTTKSLEGADALSSGVPYFLEGLANQKANSEEFETAQECQTYMMQDAKGNMTISIFNTTDVRPENRIDYHEANGISSGEGVPENEYVPFNKEREYDYLLLGSIALPAGLMFLNSDLADNATYIVKELKNGLKAIVRKDGGKIILNNKTAKNGKMLLKHLTFRGKNLNKQYNVVTNPYKNINTVEEGKKLSIVAR